MRPLTFVFDYAEVLSRAASDEDEQRMARTLGLGLEEFRASYWRERNAYDMGCTADVFWEAVAGVELSRGEVQTLVSLDISAWTNLDDAVVEVVDHLRAKGYPLVVLSNLPRELATAVRKGPLGPRFDHMVFSSDVGMVKPEPELFRGVLRDLRVPAQSAVFIDDRPANLAAAASVGMHAVPFDGSHRLVEQIERWIAPRARLKVG